MKAIVLLLQSAFIKKRSIKAIKDIKAIKKRSTALYARLLSFIISCSRWLLSSIFCVDGEEGGGSVWGIRAEGVAKAKDNLFSLSAHSIT
jgi:hypothetical protein